MTSRRIPRGPLFYVCFVAALAIGFTIGLHGFTWWLGVLLVLVIVGAALSQAGAAIRRIAEPPSGPVLCPRCEAEPRTGSGWCAPCTALLRDHPVPPGHPIQAYIAAGIARDADALADCVASTLTTQAPNGRRSVVTRDAFRRNTRLSMRFYRGGASSLVGAWLEPAATDVVWLRTRDQTNGILGSGPLDVQLVIRIRLEDGLVAESEYAPALGPQPMTGLVV